MRVSRRANYERWLQSLALGDERELLALTLATHASAFFLLTFLAHNDLVRFALLAGAALLLVLAVMNEPNRRPAPWLAWLAFGVIQLVVSCVIWLQDGLWTFTILFWFSTTIPLLLLLGQLAAVLALLVSLALLCGSFALTQSAGVTLPRLLFEQAPAWFVGALVALHLVFLPPLLLVSFARAKLIKKTHAAVSLAASHHAEVQAHRAREQQYIVWLSRDMKAQVAHLRKLLTSLNSSQEDFGRASRDHLGELARRVNELHEFAQLEAGRLRAHPKTTAMVPWLRGLVQRWNEAYPQLLLSLFSEQPLPEALVVRLDTDRVEQILHKLLQHGVALGAVSAQLRVAAHRGDVVRLEVFLPDLDISPTELERLVSMKQMRDAYAQLSEVHHTLGLVMANALAHLLGGDIHVQSVQGRGASLIVILPWEDDVSRQGSTPDALERGQVQKALAHRRVLLVDSNPVSRMAMSMQVHELSSQVSVWSADGADMLMRVLEERDVDVVLMDVHLEGIDGLQCAQQLRARWPANAPPMIGFSPSWSRELEREALRSGMLTVLAKPCDQGALQRAMLLALAQRPSPVASS